jgi:hypothetical protein
MALMQTKELFNEFIRSGGFCIALEQNERDSSQKKIKYTGGYAEMWLLLPWCNLRMIRNLWSWCGRGLEIWFITELANQSSPPRAMPTLSIVLQ